jgi:hypothetical protein
LPQRIGKYLSGMMNFGARRSDFGRRHSSGNMT